MYQDAINTLIQLFQNGNLKLFTIDKDGELWITKPDMTVQGFKTVDELLKYIEES